MGPTNTTSNGSQPVAKITGYTPLVDSVVKINVSYVAGGSANVSGGGNQSYISIKQLGSSSATTGGGSSGPSFSNVEIADKPTGGVIGTAAATVDLATNFNITQTTANQTLTLPNPTDVNTTKGKIITVNNTGTNPLSMYGVNIANGGTANAFVWNGTSWNPVNAASNVAAENGSVNMTSVSVPGSTAVGSATDIPGGTFTPLTSGRFQVSATLNGNPTAFATGSGTSVPNFALYTAANVLVPSTEVQMSGMQFNATSSAIYQSEGTGVWNVDLVAGTTYKIRGWVNGSAAGAVTMGTTGLGGVSSLKWNKISGNAPVVATGQSVDYKYAFKTTTQLAITAAADVIFDGAGNGNIPLNTATGVFTLTAGKTYELDSMLVAISNGGTAVNGSIKYQWVDGVSGTPISLGNVGMATLGGNGASSVNNATPSAAKVIYTPSTNQTVKVRMTAVTLGGASDFALLAISDTRGASYASVKQLGSSVFTAGTALSYNSLTNAVAIGSLDNTNFDQTWNWSTLTTGTAQTMTANTLTTGTLEKLTSTSANITTAGVNVGSLLDVQATGALTAMTGNIASINLGGANTAGMTGTALNVNIAGVPAFANGGVRFQFAGAHTGNGVQVDSATATGNAMRINANALTTGSGLDIVSSSASLNSTNGLLRVANTAASTTGILARFQSSSTAGSGLTINTAGQTLVNTTTSFGTGISLLVKQTTNLNGQGGIGIQDNIDSDYWNMNVDSGNKLIFGFNGTWRAGIDPANGSYITNSDSRFKHDINSLDYGLDTVLALSPKSYIFNSDETNTRRVGLIAQDVIGLVPELVSSFGEGDTQRYGVNYAGFAPILVKSIQDLNNKTALVMQNQSVLIGSYSARPMTVPTVATDVPVVDTTALAVLMTQIAAVNTESAPTVTVTQQIQDRITAGVSTLDNVISQRISAIRAYIDEIYTKKIHTELLCVKKSDGTEFCANGDQLQSAATAVGSTTVVTTVVTAAPLGGTPVTPPAPAVCTLPEVLDSATNSCVTTVTPPAPAVVVPPTVPPVTPPSDPAPIVP
jgi:Chaperone of endosialidase